MAANASTGKTREIKTDYLKVQGNCIEVHETCIQLSNVSLFSTSNLKAPSLGFIVLAVILIAFGASMINKDQVSVGMIAIALGIVIGVYWLAGWKKANSSKYLSILTNSGVSYVIAFEDLEFLSKVESAIKEIIRCPDSECNVLFDLKNSVLIGSAIGNQSHVSGR